MIVCCKPRPQATMLWSTILIVVLAMLSGPTASVAQKKKPAKAAKKAAGKKPAKVDPTAVCVNAACHTRVPKQFKHMHFPVKKKECRPCHEQQEDRHEFKVADSRAMCLDCHDELEQQGANVHKPASGDCLDCHRPHGSQTAKMLNAKSQKDLCFRCHDDKIMAQAYKHGPASAGACTMCHSPHASDNKKLLRLPGLDLCGQCHEQLAEGIKGAQQVHKPVADGCTGCHDPHSGPFPKMLPGEDEMLCAKCHEKVVALTQSAKVPHKPTTTGAKCRNCHTPHASNAAPLLKKAQVDLCVGCHNEGQEINGKKLLGMREFLKKNRDWHGPIRDGNCAGCHQPHGSENHRLLKRTYPPEFYSNFEDANYELCFGCHEAALVQQKTTRTLTGFRDGNRNLHFLHVNKENRGRTCRACHEVHASARPLHIREEVPYGTWLLPINFEKSANGGSCSPGCHEAVKYDRGDKGKKRAPKKAKKRKVSKRRKSQ